MDDHIAGAYGFAGMFGKLEAAGYKGHFTTAFGSLRDVIEGRASLTREGQKAGMA